MTNSNTILDEEARRIHLETYGSILFCPKRDTLCSFMEGAWLVGCGRTTCILDDPEYQKLKQRQQERRDMLAEEERRHRMEERESEKIRNQTKQERSFIDQKLEEAHRLEEMSQKAFRRNKPNKGHEYFNRAKNLRFEAYNYAKERGIRL